GNSNKASPGTTGSRSPPMTSCSRGSTPLTRRQDPQGREPRRILNELRCSTATPCDSFSRLQLPTGRRTFAGGALFYLVTCSNRSKVPSREKRLQMSILSELDPTELRPSSPAISSALN